MKRVGSYEAKTRLAQILKEVEAGETVVITRNGHPIAQLSAHLEESEGGEVVLSAPDQAMARLLRSTARLKGIRLADLRDDGRSH